MLPDEFKDQIDRLVKMFTPRGWSGAAEDEYFRAFQNWSPDRFRFAVSRCIREEERMPKPIVIMRHDKMLGRPATEKIKKADVSSCPMCVGGLILFQVPDHRYTVPSGYSEKTLACDCEGGDIQAERIVLVEIEMGRSKTQDGVRYSVYAAAHGLPDPIGGIGVQMEGYEISTGVKQTKRVIPTIGKKIGTRESDSAELERSRRGEKLDELPF